MGSSPGFGSRPSDKSALFGLAFATAPAKNCLSHAAENEVVGSLGKRNAVTPLARGSNSLFASHFRDYFIPLSGCFSPFPHGTIRYRSLCLFSLGWWSTRIRAGLHVSDRTQESSAVRSRFGYWALTVLGRPFQDVRLRSRNRFVKVLQPLQASLKVWAFPGSLATTTGISNLISFPPLLRCFSSQSIPPGAASGFRND